MGTIDAPLTIAAMLLLDFIAELGVRREAANLRNLLAIATDDGERKRAAAKLALIEMALEAQGRSPLPRGAGYRVRIVERLDRKA